jgi:hypothetical protein
MINAFTIRVSLLFIIASFLRLLLLRRLDVRVVLRGFDEVVFPPDSTEAWSRGTSIGASSRCGGVLQAVDRGVFSKRLDAGALPLFDS